MLSSNDLLILVLVLGAILGVSVVTRYRQRSFAEYATAGKRVPSSVLFASLCATAIGPGFSLGLAGKASQSGLFFLPIFAGFALQFIVVGKWVAPRLHRFSGAHTLGDVVEAHFDRNAKRLIGLASLLLCTGLAAVMVKVGAGSLHALLGWPEWAGMLVIAVIGASSSFTGGLSSVIAAEAIQFSIKTAVVALMVLLLSRQLDWSDVLALGMVQAQGKTEAVGIASMAGLFLTFAFGELLIPPYANRALAARSSSGSGAVFMWTGMFSLVWFLLVCLLGISANRLGLAGNPDLALIEIGKQVLPTGGAGLLGAVIFAIVLSSYTSVLNAGAASFAADSWIAAPQQRATVARFATLVIAVLACLLSLWSPSIVDGLLLAYSFWVPVAVGPILFAAFGWRVPRMAGTLAIVAGFMTAVLFTRWHWFDGAATLLGLGISLATLALAHLYLTFKEQ